MSQLHVLPNELTVTKCGALSIQGTMIIRSGTPELFHNQWNHLPPWYRPTGDGELNVLYRYVNPERPPVIAVFTVYRPLERPAPRDSMHLIHI